MVFLIYLILIVNITLGKLIITVNILNGDNTESTPSAAYDKLLTLYSPSYKINNIQVLNISSNATIPTPGGSPNPGGPMVPSPDSAGYSLYRGGESFTFLMVMLCGWICFLFSENLENKKRGLVGLFLLYLVTSSVAIQTYDNCLMLESTYNYKIFWTVDSANGVLKVAQQADITSGWLAMGISSNGAMPSDGQSPGSDIILGFVDPACTNGYCISDYNTVVYDLPNLDTIQDVTPVSGVKTANQIQLEWTRKLNTGDTSADRVIDPSIPVNIIWSMNNIYTPSSNKVFTKHIKAGMTPIVFNQISKCPGQPGEKTFVIELNTRLFGFDRDQFKTSIATDMQISPNRVFIEKIEEIEDVFCPQCVIKDVRFPNYLIPAEVTTYVSFGLRLPVDAYRHIIRIEPLIDNALMLHHILIFIGGGNVPENNNTILGGMPKSTYYKPLFAWAPGADRFDLPANVGFNAASDPAKDYYLILNHHYNNPTKLSDQRDSSGIRVYLDTPRANNASFSFIGIVTGINIPPNRNLYRQGGYYNILAQLPVPLNVFATLPHMHTHGQKIWLEVIRGGNTFAEYGKILSWDFNSQKVYLQSGTLLGGDKLITQCLYNTEGETENIEGGEDTYKEMCLVGLAYYPDIGASQIVYYNGFLAPVLNCDYPCKNYNSSTNPYPPI